VPIQYQHALKAALDRRHKATATAADEARTKEGTLPR
jgi:hypothetical protein